MTKEEIEFFKSLLITVRREIEPVYRGVDPFTMREKTHKWPDTLDLVDHGIALLSGDHRPPAQEIRDAVTDSKQTDSIPPPLTLQEPK